MCAELREAKKLLEAMERRKQQRYQNGSVGEWQTEINEVARALHYLLAHIDGAKPRVPNKCCADDVDDYY